MRHESPPALGRDDRVARERDFHDQRYADDPRSATQKYYAIETGAAAYDRTLDLVERGADLLEYGCGLGSKGFDLAARGVQVTGIDISPVAISEATAEAERRGVPARFVTMDAHRLDFPDGCFDVVCGSGILHHLDLADSLSEVARVMRPGGVAVFYEPLGTNPIINLYRRLTPRLRSVDEHPLVSADFELAANWFGTVETEVFTCFALAGAILGRFGPASRLTPLLVRLDRWMFRRLPWSRRFAWVVVIRLAEPRQHAANGESQ